MLNYWPVLVFATTACLKQYKWLDVYKGLELSDVLLKGMPIVKLHVVDEGSQANC